MGQRKPKASRLALWMGPETSEVHHVCGGECTDEVESFFHQLWHIMWHPTCPSPCKPSIKSKPYPFRVPLLASWVAAEENSGESYLGVEFFSVDIQETMAGRGGYKGRGRGGGGNNQEQWQQPGQMQQQFQQQLQMQMEFAQPGGFGFPQQ
jgi:hypothetical protein